MEDLSALSNALKEASQSKEESRFVDVVELYLKSADLGIRLQVASILLDILQHIDKDDLKFILDSATLRLYPLLFPLVGDSLDARDLVLFLVDHTPPFETTISLGEILYNIQESALGQSGLSDDGEDEMITDTDEQDLTSQFQVVLEVYTTTFPLMKDSPSTKVLLAPYQKIESILPILSQDLDITAARALYSAFAHFVSSAWSWVKISKDAGGEQKSMLTRIIYMATATISPRIEARLAERWFIANFPRYKTTGSVGLVEPLEYGSGQDVLESVNSSISDMGVTPNDIVDTLIHPSSHSPHASLAALTLLTASLPEMTQSAVAQPHSPLIEDCMPVLTAALSHSAIDVGLAYLWSLLQNGGQVPYENATMLLELLVPLAAQPPSPLLRTLVLNLIAKVIEAVPSGDDQTLLFKRLLEEDNLFPQIRVQALTLLRQAITTADAPILTAKTLNTLHDTLFTLPSSSRSAQPPSFGYSTRIIAQDVKPLEMSSKDFAGSMYAAWFTDTANLLRLWVLKDEANVTSIRDRAVLAKISTEWLNPQMKRVGELKEEHQSDVQIEFVLARWEDALQRAEEVIQPLLA